MDHLFDVHILLFILLCHYYYRYTTKLLAINIHQGRTQNKFPGGNMDIIIGDNLLLITYLIKYVLIFKLC